jgi:hypothetical protein
MGIEDQVPEEAPARPEEVKKTSPLEVKDKRLHRKYLAVATMFIVILAAILIGVFVSQDKNDNDSSSSKLVEESATVPPADDEDPTTPSPTEIKFFKSDVGPFDIKVPLYSPEKLGVYQDLTEARPDFEILSKFLLNNVVLRNLGRLGFSNAAFGFAANKGVDDAIDFGIEAPQLGVPAPSDPNGEAAGDAASASEGDTSSGSGQVGDDANSFGTNNQEEKVDTADVAKSDGEYIYAAFGDYLLITKADDGELVLRIPMPVIEVPDDYNTGPYYVEPDFVDVPEVFPVETAAGDGSATTKSMPPPAFYWRPTKATIQSLLLTENRLALIVSGYGFSYRNTVDEPIVLNDFLSTQIRLYSLENLRDDEPSLPFLGKQDVNGHFKKGFVIEDDNVAHIVTSSSLTYDTLVAPVERYSNPKYYDLSDDDYVKSVVQAAKETIVEDFVDALFANLCYTGDCPKIALLGLLTEKVSSEEGFTNLVYPNGYANSVVQISSFNMEDAIFLEDSLSEKEDPTLSVESVVHFLPTYWSQVYSATDMLVLFGQGSNFVSNNEQQEATFLFGYKLNGISAVPAVSGSVPGSLLNSFSIDYTGGYFRVATTIRNIWTTAIFGSEVMPVDSVTVVVDGATSQGRAGDTTDAGGEIVTLFSECRSNVDCNDDQYCGGGVCRDFGACGQDVDCFNPSNVYFAIECLGVLQCTDGQCGKECTGEMCPNGEVLVKCFAPPCAVATATDCEEADACVDYYCGGCNSIQFDVAGTQVCNEEEMVPEEDTQCPSPDDLCMTDENGRSFYDLCRAVEDDCPGDLAILESCPYQFACREGEEFVNPVLTECLKLKEDDNCVDDYQSYLENYNECLSFQADEFCYPSLIFSCPPAYVFVCESVSQPIAEPEIEPEIEISPPIAERSTKNQIFVLEISEENNLKIVGSVILGFPREGMSQCFITLLKWPVDFH